MDPYHPNPTPATPDNILPPRSQPIPPQQPLQPIPVPSPLPQPSNTDVPEFRPTSPTPVQNIQPSLSPVVPPVPITPASFVAGPEPVYAVQPLPSPTPQYQASQSEPVSIVDSQSPLQPAIQPTMDLPPVQQNLPAFMNPSDGQSPATPGTTYSTPVPPVRGSKKKKLFIVIPAVIVILAAVSAGVVFGYYIPNKPENVYKTGINRSAKALDKLVSTATQKSKLDGYNKSDINLSVDASYAKTKFTGTFNAKFDATKANSELTFVSNGSEFDNMNVTAKVMGELPKDGQFPDIYMQFTGLKTLPLDSYLPGFTQFDGKWISVSSNYLKTLGTFPAAEETNKKELTSDDIAELAQTATKVTTQYVFSTSTDKAVFENKGFVGKEKVDGTNTYHYKVAINKEHLKDYCVAMVDQIYSTNAYKKIPWVDEKTVDKDKENEKKTCSSSPSQDDNSKDDSYELWVDAEYELIYKIRETDYGDSGVYTDFGQIYKGGDEVSLFVAYHDDKGKSDGKFTLTSNLKNATTKGELTYKGGEGDNTYDLKITLEAKPYNGDISVDKPANSVPIQDVIKKLGMDPSGISDIDGGSVGTKAANTERQTDIKAIHGQLEAYYAQNGRYPTLANVNDKTWRSSNMKGLDDEALNNPAGAKDYKLAAKPAANIYSYEVTSSSKTACNNAKVDCAVYSLTATYEGGGTFSKTNLN